MKKAITALLCTAGGLVVGLAVQYTISERRLPTTVSFDTLPTLGDLAAIATAGGFIGILIALWLQRKANESARQVATRDATEAIFKRWWGLDPGYAESAEDITAGIRRDIPALRGYFYSDFLGWYKTNSSCLAKTRLKEFFKVAKAATPSLDDRGRLANLTFFFDQVGWLGAAGLIDVDYVLGPMQHTLRRVWWVTKPWIENERKKEVGYWLDPVRHFGIEWLYQRSVVTPQVDLIQGQFPDVLTLSQRPANATLPATALQRQLAEDEAEFLSMLPETLRNEILVYDKAILAKRKHRRSHGQEHARLLQALVETRTVGGK